MYRGKQQISLSMKLRQTVKLVVALVNMCEFYDDEEDDNPQELGDMEEANEAGLGYVGDQEDDGWLHRAFFTNRYDSALTMAPHLLNHQNRIFFFVSAEHIHDS